VFEKGILPHIGNLTLEIHHLDIGQGDSTLIVIRDFGEIIYTVLIDAADAGEAPLIHEYMNRLGVISLDTLVITHYDKDHFRGALALLTHSKICQRTLVFDRGDPEDVDLLKKFKLGIDPQEVDDDRLYEDEIAELKELLYGRGQKQRICAGKKPNWMVGKELVSFARPDQPPVLTLTCVAANGYILGGGYVQPQHRDRENAMSLCLLLRFGSFVYYFGGDAPGVPSNDVETAVGNAVLAQLGLDHICGMKASHHGSHHSTLPGFVDLINPTCAFISCGIQHGHPRQQAIDTLEGTPGLQNYYMTRCAYRRNHITPHNSIQKGKARVAGDESTLGTIVLRIEQSTANDHVFYVGYWDREAATWRLNRHCCTHDEIYEEITFVEETPEELAVTACEDIHPGEHAQESVLLEDAIERQRAARDEELVRGFGVRGRDARRSLREDDEPAEPPPPPKTIQTEEMVDELDERYEREMQQKEDAEYDDDDEYS
jgi:beta-lactamase superfamily II metal-dependent hydrolase